ncbi:hypothetical protein [Brucella pituitosa]|uniref:hypothetical protein n=1 Tax=Brucella pituitosa TaxID=571256 RepID=UPI0011B01AB0
MLIVVGISANQSLKGWWQMKIIAWALGVLFTVWLTAFTWFKGAELGCAQDLTICAHATGAWFRKLVLLEWASKWQTLLAGIAAILAGAFVILAAKISARDEENRTNRKNYSASMVACSIISDEFRDLANQFELHRTSASTPVKVSSHLVAFSIHLSQLHFINATVGSMLTSARLEAERVAHFQAMSSSTDGKAMAAKAYLISAALKQIGYKLSNDGRLHTQTELLSAEDSMVRKIRSLGIFPEKIEYWSSLFNWPK